jgi:hypothetical protein
MTIQTALPILLILIANLCNGQTPNFFADGSRWVYHTHESSEPGQQLVHNTDEQHIIHGDTLINGIAYFKLYTTRHNILDVYTFPATLTYHTYDSLGPSFLRYDTLVKHVYYLPSIDSTERLIYDFDLQVGDTTPMQTEYLPTSIIRSIDTVSLFGTAVKRFFMADVNDPSIEHLNYILEGMGGSNGFAYYQPEVLWLGGMAFSTSLRCFQYQDSIYAPYDGECPFVDFISAIDPISENHNVTLSPNPTQGHFTVSISEELLNATCTIVNSLGQAVQSLRLTEQNTTGQLRTPGIYFWRVERDGRLIRSGKLVCE